MCNEAVKRELVERLCELGSVCSKTASIHDLRLQLVGKDVSNNVFKQALGSAINGELVVRRRPQATALYDDERPITLEATRLAKRIFLSQPVHSQPYFVS